MPQSTASSLTRAFQAWLGVLLLAGSNLALADWQLDPAASSLNFVSIKNEQIGEVHGFSGLQGRVSDRGEASVSIGLDSVETNIPIRNERMREMLFETAEFPVATIGASVEIAQFEALGQGESLPVSLPITINLHGVSLDTRADLRVTRLTETTWQVASATPLIVRASDFGLIQGIDVLRTVAGLTTIATAVPVTINLVFRAGE